VHAGVSFSEKKSTSNDFEITIELLSAPFHRSLGCCNHDALAGASRRSRKNSGTLNRANLALADVCGAGFNLINLPQPPISPSTAKCQ